MEMIPIAAAALAFIGLVMMVIAVVMYAKGGKRQVKVVIPTSTAGKMPPGPPAPQKVAPPPPPPAAKAEPPKAPPPPPPVLEPPKVDVKPPAPPKPEPPAPVLNVDPNVSEEGTRIAMIPPPEPIAPPPLPPPPPPAEATIAQPLPTARIPLEPPAAEEPQSTMAISAGDMSDFRTIVEQAAPKSYGSLVGLSGGVQGREVRIDEEGFVIGRDQRAAQFVISDPRISKRHVWVGVRDGEVWAVDVGSTNGTYLNAPRSERITETKLQPGDVIILSEDAARFEYRK